MLVRDTVKNLPKKFEDKYLTLQIFYHISLITCALQVPTFNST